MGAYTYRFLTSHIPSYVRKKLEQRKIRQIAQEVQQRYKQQIQNLQKQLMLESKRAEDLRSRVERLEELLILGFDPEKATLFQHQLKQLQKEHNALAQRTQQALSEGTKELVDSLSLPERSDE